jgi:hypothetical protein
VKILGYDKNYKSFQIGEISGYIVHYFGRFMQNRDVHSKDYYKFLFSLVTVNTTEYR